MNDKTLVIKSLEDANNIAIFGHENPDGDCIGSMLGLWWLLEKQWKKVSYFTPNPVGRTFLFLEWTEKIKSDFDYWIYDILVFLDFSGYRRMWTIATSNEKYFNENKIIVIDHHLWNETPSHALVYKDPEVMSNCELIFEITWDIWKEYYDPKIATSLYVGILTDSGVFRYDRWIDQSKRLFSNSIWLLELGADKVWLLKKLFRSKRFEAVEFMQTLLGRMKYEWDVLYSYFTQNELNEKSIDEEEAIYAQFMMQEIAWPKLVVIFKVFPEYIKWSVRTNDLSMNCEKVAAAFNWWWHEAAAWFKIESNWDYIEMIESTVKKIQSLI